MKDVLIIGVLVMCLCGAASGDDGAGSAKAEFFNTAGERIGTAVLREIADGVLITVQLSKVPPGPHALHIHAVGKCEQPFATAGGHFNPYEKKHGFLNPDGPHAGDLPNIHAGADGVITVEMTARQVNLGGGRSGLFHGDGTSLIIHAGPDDYRSDPAGNSGQRIACAVIRR